MTEYKKQRLYSETQEINTDDEITLKSSKSFSENSPMIIAEDDTQLNSDVAISEIISPRKPRWKAKAFAASFTGLVGWQLGDSLVTAWQTNDWLQLGWLGLASLIGLAGIGEIIKELIRLKKLSRVQSYQERTIEIIAESKTGKAEAICGEINDLSPHIHRDAIVQWQQANNGSLSDEDVFKLYDHYVLSPLDKLALNIVTKNASEAAALVAISPLALVDMLMVAWRTISMVNRVSAIYGVELGYWSRIRLLKSVVKTMVAAGASELVLDAGLDMVTSSVLSKLSARAGQGVGVGLMTARLGIQTIRLVRPVPWLNDNAVNLRSIRPQIIQHVTKLTSLSKDK